MRILLIDDSPDVCDMLGLLLQMDGYDVQCAYSGQSGVKAAQDFLPEVAVIDIGLPDLNGLEVARAIRKLPAVKDTILIALSGYSEDSDRERAAEAGFDHYVVKPANAQELIKLFHSPARVS